MYCGPNVLYFKITLKLWNIDCNFAKTTADWYTTGGHKETLALTHSAKILTLWLHKMFDVHCSKASKREKLMKTFAFFFSLSLFFPSLPPSLSLSFTKAFAKFWQKGQFSLAPKYQFQSFYAEEKKNAIVVIKVSFLWKVFQEKYFTPKPKSQPAKKCWCKKVLGLGSQLLLLVLYTSYYVDEISALQW